MRRGLLTVLILEDCMCTVQIILLACFAVLVWECQHTTLKQGQAEQCATCVQARDVEASLQEQLLEQFHELVLARAVAAGTSGRSQAALAAAVTAAELLRPILAVLPASGAAGSACLGRACAALHAKKRLKGKATAAGLQSIIQHLTAQGTRCNRSASACSASQPKQSLQ